jgi:hypothetical protein
MMVSGILLGRRTWRRWRTAYLGGSDFEPAEKTAFGDTQTAIESDHHGHLVPSELHRPDT